MPRALTVSRWSVLASLIAADLLTRFGLTMPSSRVSSLNTFATHGASAYKHHCDPEGRVERTSETVLLSEIPSKAKSMSCYVPKSCMADTSLRATMFREHPTPCLPSLLTASKRDYNTDSIVFPNAVPVHSWRCLNLILRAMSHLKFRLYTEDPHLLLIYGVQAVE